MADAAPTNDQWFCRIIDEERPLLEAHAENSSSGANPPAHAVISKKTHNESFPVDHGWLPWVQVVAGWILFANSWGLPSAYGTFQTYYTQSLLSGHDTATIAWIGSVQLFLCTLGCLPAGIMLDRGYLRSLIAAGTVLEVIGLLVMSFSTHYWQILISQGVITGIGCGILGLLPVSVISMYFEEKRMLAAGIAATGAGFTGIVQPIVLKHLFEAIGFHWSIRILALTVLLSNTIPFLVMRLQSEGTEGRSSFTFNHFKEVTYSTFVCTFTLIQAAAMVPVFFIQEYALSLGIEEASAFQLLALIDIAGLFGRFVPNFVADRYGGINTLLPLIFVSMMLLITLPLFKTLSSLIVFCLLYGFTSGGALVLPATIITKLSPNAADLGVRMGLAYLFAALGGLVGNPLSGAAKNDNASSAIKQLQGVWWVAAGMLGISLVTLLAARWNRIGTMLGRGVV